MNNIWNELFDRIYAINLPFRPDRLESIEDEMKSVGITEYYLKLGVIVNDGKTLEDRERGCRLAHMTVIQEAKDLNLNRILLLEDDTAFEDNADVEVLKNKELLKLDTWDLFYLGANVWQGQYYSLHAYAVNKRAYDKLLSYRNIDKPLDVLIVDNLQKEGNCHCIKPRICYQKEGYSNIQNEVKNYDNFLRGDIK